MSKENVDRGIALITAFLAFFPKTRERVNSVLMSAEYLDNAHTVAKSTQDAVLAAAEAQQPLMLTREDVLVLASVIRQGKYLISMAKKR